MKISWMEIARKESLKSDFKHRIGAVVISGGSVLSKGFNQIRHSSEFKEHARWDESLHAERDALRKIKNKKDLEGASVYIYREHRNGSPALALPCEHCFKLLKAVGIKKIYFSQDKFPFFGEIRL